MPIVWWSVIKDNWNVNVNVSHDDSIKTTRHFFNSSQILLIYMHIYFPPIRDDYMIDFC